MTRIKVTVYKSGKITWRQNNPKLKKQCLNSLGSIWPYVKITQHCKMLLITCQNNPNRNNLCLNNYPWNKPIAYLLYSVEVILTPVFFWHWVTLIPVCYDIGLYSWRVILTLGYIDDESYWPRVILTKLKRCLLVFPGYFDGTPTIQVVTKIM